MALPTFEESMLPLLRHIADGRQYSYADVIPLLKRDFRLWSMDPLASLPGAIDKSNLQRFPAEKRR